MINAGFVSAQGPWTDRVVLTREDAPEVEVVLGAFAFDGELLAGDAYEAAGTLSNSVVTLGVVNSHGVKTVCNTTAGKFTVLYTGSDSSGYYEDFLRDFAARMHRCTSPISPHTKH